MSDVGSGEREILQSSNYASVLSSINKHSIGTELVLLTSDWSGHFGAIKHLVTIQHILCVLILG